MAEIAALISAAVAAAAATAGAVGSSVSRNKANRERTRSYNEAKDYLNSQYYRDPLSTVSNRSILKKLEDNLRDQNDAMQNRAAAGGATMENQLAARKANNHTIGEVYSNLLLGEDARRDRINQQKLALDRDYSNGTQQNYLQAAQNWQAWGSQMANAALSYGSSSLLSGAAGSGVQGIGSVSASSMPGNVVTSNAIGANGMAGGLAGVPSYLK